VTIEKGSPWGEAGSPPEGAAHFSSVAQLASVLNGGPHGSHHISEAANTGAPPEYVLQSRAFSTLLGRRPRTASGYVRIPIDVLDVEYETRSEAKSRVVIDSLVIGSGYLQGSLTVVTNTGYWLGRRIAPRAHPNDGRLDVLTVAPNMSRRHRLMALRRARWGLHVPHPSLSVVQSDGYDWSGRPTKVKFDGHTESKVTSLRVRVRTDAIVIYV
jgi:hypothetical protein